MQAPRQPAPEAEEFRPITRRRKVLIAFLAVATTSTVMWSLLREPGGAELGRKVRNDLQAAALAASGAASLPGACVDSGTTRCVGGKADVILLPPPQK
jgi:hypothetical protein